MTPQWRIRLDAYTTLEIAITYKTWYESTFEYPNIKRSKRHNKCLSFSCGALAQLSSNRYLSERLSMCYRVPIRCDRFLLPRPCIKWTQNMSNGSCSCPDATRKSSTPWSPVRRTFRIASIESPKTSSQTVGKGKTKRLLSCKIYTRILLLI